MSEWLKPCPNSTCGELFFNAFTCAHLTRGDMVHLCCALIMSTRVPIDDYYNSQSTDKVALICQFSYMLVKKEAENQALGEAPVTRVRSLQGQEEVETLPKFPQDSNFSFFSVVWFSRLGNLKM